MRRIVVVPHVSFVRTTESNRHREVHSMGTTASAPGDDRAQTTAPHADDDLALAGLRAQAALIASGDASSRELVDAALGRIDASQPELNAFRCVRADAARAEADAADRRRAQGEQL